MSAIKAQLHATLAELDQEDRLGKSSQSTVTLDQQAVGRLSRMDALQAQSMAQAQQTRRDQSRLRIAAALTRLSAGEWGYCQDCGEEIEPKRLSFDPTIPKCLSCAKG